MSGAPSADAALTRRILSETSRFAALQVLAAVLAWGANVLLGRVLAQRDFGTYDISTFWIGVGPYLGDGGLGATLLRRKGEVSATEYRVALTSIVAVSTGLACVLFFGAPWIGARSHFSATEIDVLRAMSPLYVLNAFRMIPYVRLERELRFSTIARIELASSLLRHVLAISVALLRGGVWALVASNLAATALQLGLAYRAAPGWVGFGWSWRVFRPLISYGGRVQALNVCSFLKDNISPALLGGALGPVAVGVFDFGMKYIQIPVVAVNSLARVQLPVYARLEAEDPTLYRALRGAMRAALLLGVPVLAALAVAASYVVPAVYGDKWRAADPVIWALLANMIGGLVASPLFTLLQGQGRAGVAVLIFVAWTSVTWLLAILALVFVPGSLAAVALAHSVVTAAVVVALLVWAGRHLKRGLLRSLVAPVISGGAGLAAAIADRRWNHGWMTHPMVAAFACTAVYFTVLFALEGRVVWGELQTIARSMRPKRRESAGGSGTDDEANGARGSRSAP